jgi:hypothetical protein
VDSQGHVSCSQSKNAIFHAEKAFRKVSLNEAGPHVTVTRYMIGLHPGGIDLDGTFPQFPSAFRHGVDRHLWAHSDLWFSSVFF